MSKEIPYKIYLEESELPKAWYNLRADMKEKPAPLLDPKTHAPATLDMLSQVFCRELAEQELNETDAYIEIPKGSKSKYELDKETGLLRLDRILHTSTRYPANYGFIPLTFAQDLDPLDVLVLCSETVYPGTLIECYPIGYIRMIDSGYNDEKIIAIPFNDPNYNIYTDISQLPPHIFREMCHFFSVYKSLEQSDKYTKVQDVKGATEAEAIISQAIKDYKKTYGGMLK